jgi:hypothetical protein
VTLYVTEPWLREVVHAERPLQIVTFLSLAYFLPEFVDRLTAAFGIDVPARCCSPRTTPRRCPRAVRARPPEHNEGVSITIASNHQTGLALDLQPSATSGATRILPARCNPLFIAALHDVAQRAYRTGRLGEALWNSPPGISASGKRRTSIHLQGWYRYPTRAPMISEPDARRCD